MKQTVNFTPSSINCGVTRPGTTSAAVTQCAPITSPANVTASITNDTSGGALTILSIASYLPQVIPPGPPGPPRGYYFQTKIESPAPGPEVLPIPIREGPPRLMVRSHGVTPLAVAAGEFVEVTVLFAPTASTPAVCTATLQINGDTWNPVSLPITAAVNELKVSVPLITVKRGASTSVEIEVTSVAGSETSADLYLQANASFPNVPNVTASLNTTWLPIGPGKSVFATLSVSAASDLSEGTYFWNLGVSAFGSAFGNVYSFSVPVTINVGAPYFFIKSKLGNVIDVAGASTKAGALLDAWPQKSSGTDNQLWEFVPAPADSGYYSGSWYYFIKSKLGNVIDVSGASTKAGALLDAWPQKSSGTDNQLWEFVADPAGSGYCFIKSKLNGNVIDVAGASTAPGARLNAYPWKLTGYDNQLWTVVDGSFPSVVETVPQREGGDSGYFNYLLANDASSCATLTGVKVTIYFTEDLVWESSSPRPGFSIQLNAETNNNQPLDWLQFVVLNLNDQNLWPWIEIWTPTQVLWNHPFLDNPVAKMPQAARIPAGYSIVIALQNDNEGRVTGATWTVLDGSGNPVVGTYHALSNTEGGGVPPSDLSPIASFQLTFGGPFNGGYATFSSGAGVMIYEADQAMIVDSSWPTCIGYQGGTGESSNIGYSALEATPSTLFSQAFGVVQDSPHMRRKNPNARKLRPPPTQ